jgi:hypothetical protein
VRRLDAADHLARELPEVVAAERAQWDVFYDALDALEMGLATDSSQAAATADQLRRVIDDASLA